VDLHAIAWHEAMLKFGHEVSFGQARGQIGKGGDKLIPVFLADDEQRDHGKELEQWRADRFKTEYLPLVRPFSAVPELLRRVRKSGLRVAVASSAKKDEVDKYMEIARISDLVDVTTSSGRDAHQLTHRAAFGPSAAGPRQTRETGRRRLDSSPAHRHPARPLSAPADSTRYTAVTKMTKKLFYDPQHWHERAQDARRVAREILDPISGSPSASR
jgi:hypothetical protein